MAAQKDLDFGMKCIKYMLGVANLMFVFVGILLISIGYTIKGIYQNFEQFMSSHYYNPSTLAIVIGFFIFLIALFGCIGAIKESTFLVNTYAFLLAIVLILEISVSIAAYAMRSNIEGSVSSNMRYAMERYDLEFNAFTWNATQYNLQCCGIRNYTEWSEFADRFLLVTVPSNETNPISVPQSCCVNENCSSTSNLYKRPGCLYRLSYIVSQCALLLAIGAVCVSFIQILGIIFAHMLAKSIRKLKTQMLVEKEERRRKFYEQMVKNELEKAKSPTLYTPKDSEA